MLEAYFFMKKKTVGVELTIQKCDTSSWRLIRFCIYNIRLHIFISIIYSARWSCQLLFGASEITKLSFVI